jgi:hypothetical protein
MRQAVMGVSEGEYADMKRRKRHKLVLVTHEIIFNVAVDQREHILIFISKLKINDKANIMFLEK